MSFASPLRYPGGKTKVYDNLISLFKENTIEKPTYIEPYAGGAGLALKLLLKGDVSKIILNDYDIAVYAFWYSILNYTDEFCELIKNTPINLKEWENQKKIQSNENVSLLTLGFSTFFLNRTNRSGILKGGPIGGKEQNSNYLIDCRFNKEGLIKRIKNVAEYKDFIEIHNLDAIVFINKIIIPKKEKTFTFFDPPYYKKGPGLYENHYLHDDHEKVAKTIGKLKDHNWIITYDNVNEIKEIYKKFHVEEYGITYSAAIKIKAKEVVIFSDNLKNKKFEKKRV
ncbi:MULTISPECIES: DNA adenine methylase [Psychrilyobacter]|uniref:site-specific DNA-methyltransferase (adenine-specific) n=1 Tax=Psychrilyobacter piezotolerans TaxID=2293438 RepID=A0ABX9KJN3_9FUSO|nr:MULTISPECIES: DNA adenine methylase [Psychrilyobacter]MCS5421871.1 DNA adenine methylase [Psychrilyobacter sp. S5]NDI76974.1 DNA adenine methylase [Psychrilyobacter piezotolerans]RDE64591.1 DNA adenine methylase [Psychrilyobacter sp. S5]REI42403.1 DNA adenine methylase [Psychrilyobacter piezotolerans]